MRNQREAGVTLVEVLIAVTLLSLLSAGILTAMRLGLSTMDRTDARMVRNRRVTNARRIIENEIAGLMPEIANVPLQNGGVNATPFFEAEPATMRFVTAYSLDDAWRGRPQIVTFQVIAGEKNEGVRLVVDETPYTGPAQAGMLVSGYETLPTVGLVAHYVPAVAGPKSFVVADRLRICRFSYLEKHPAPPFDVWQTLWPAIDRIPSGVRIEMEALDAPSNELRVTTMTVPLPVNGRPGTNYAAM